MKFKNSILAVVFMTCFLLSAAGCEHTKGAVNETYSKAKQADAWLKEVFW